MSQDASWKDGRLGGRSTMGRRFEGQKAAQKPSHHAAHELASQKPTTGATSPGQPSQVDALGDVFDPRDDVDDAPLRRSRARHVSPEGGKGQAQLVGRVGSFHAMLTPSQGVQSLSDRAGFDALARLNDVPGSAGAREVKFLITDVDDPSKRELYFINTNNIAYHYDFATKALGLRKTLSEFNGETYFRDDRKNLAGTLVAHDAYAPASGGPKGVYSLEFWPTDPVQARHVATAFQAIEEQMPFAKGQLRYHPAGETQEELFRQDGVELASKGVASIDSDTLFKGITYQPMNLGEGFGYLRVIDGSSPRPATVRDVAVFKNIPNDLSHVAGILTEAPQTGLSHINLKAKQNNTPNAYLAEASKDKRVQDNLDQLVHFQVAPDGLTIETATPQEAADWLESVRPADGKSPTRDLTAKSIRPLSSLGHADKTAFGAKVANLAELQKILPRNTPPEGFGIPFAFYDAFMRENRLYEKAEAMMADPDFKNDPKVREEKLVDFQRAIRNAPMPAALSRSLKSTQGRFEQLAGGPVPIRARSSTNNEDLEGFNGAGLYDSFTYRPDRRNDSLEVAVKKVWGSLWNFRAFEERDFYKVDHLKTAMGVLLTRNYDDERANGVAVTKNLFDPNWEGFYVNVQVGESLVTNPDPSATPDEVLLARIGQNGEWETQYVRRSSLVKDENPNDGVKPAVLTPTQLAELRRHMERIHEHFATVYGKQGDKSFAMDLEFKVDAGGRLIIKQARPWVD